MAVNPGSTETHELFGSNSTAGPGEAARTDNLARERLANDLAFAGLKPSALAGSKVGSVRIEELLGAGGMGEVYRGFDEKLERPVAIKTMLARHRLDEHAKARFLREARVLSKLQHPGICQVFDLLQAESADLLVIELIEGRTLRERAPELKTDEKLRIARQIAEALAVAHKRGIVHRDLKPENVMVTPEAGAKILDFGIARSYVAGGPHTADVPEPARTDGAEAVALNNLGLICQERSELDGAEAYLTEALEIARAMGGRDSMAERLANLGVIATAKRDYRKAESVLSEALAVLQEIGNTRVAGHTYGLLAQVYLAEGKLPAARKCLDQFRPAYKQDEYWITLFEARYQYELGNFAAAARLAEEAKKAAGERWGETEQGQLNAYQQSAREGRKVLLPD